MCDIVFPARWHRPTTDILLHLEQHKDSVKSANRKSYVICKKATLSRDLRTSSQLWTAPEPTSPKNYRVKMFYQTETARRPPKGPKMGNAPFLYWWPWPLTLTFKLSERGTNHVFRLNLAQIRPAVPEIFHSYTNIKHRLTAPKTEHSAVHCVR